MAKMEGDLKGVKMQMQKLENTITNTENVSKKEITN